MEDARRAARGARICYLQFKTQGIIENSPAFNELWRLWNEQANAKIENMKNCCASGYTLRKTNKREPDDDAEAGKEEGNVTA